MPEVNIFLDFFHSISFENYLNFKGKNSFTCLSPVNVIHGAYTSDYLAILNVLEYVTNGSYTAPIKASIEVKTTPAWINSCSKLLVKKSGKSQIVPSDFETRAITSFELRKEKQRFNTHPNYNKGFRTTAECLAPFNKCRDPFYNSEKKSVLSDLVSRYLDNFCFFKTCLNDLGIESDIFKDLTDLSNNLWQTTVCGFELNRSNNQFLQKLHDFILATGFTVFIATSNPQIRQFFEAQEQTTIYAITRQNEIATLQLVKPRLNSFQK